MWGRGVVIPLAGRSQVMEELHAIHPRASCIKSLARSYVWWPGMDADLGAKVRQCEPCQQHQRMPAKAPVHPWDWLERPWSHVHADYAGPFMGRMFLLLVNVHSKWSEVLPTTSATTPSTNSAMEAVFATHGMPELLVTDNGPAFASDEFEAYLKANGIQHAKTSHYHPASNGLVEQCMQMFKRAMKEDDWANSVSAVKLPSSLSDYSSHIHWMLSC